MEKNTHYCNNHLHSRRCGRFTVRDTKNTYFVFRRSKLILIIGTICLLFAGLLELAILVGRRENNYLDKHLERIHESRTGKNLQ